MLRTMYQSSKDYFAGNKYKTCHPIQYHYFFATKCIFVGYHNDEKKFCFSRND